MAEMNELEQAFEAIRKMAKERHARVVEMPRVRADPGYSIPATGPAYECRTVPRVRLRIEMEVECDT